MNQASPPEMPTHSWYGKPENIDYLFYCLFEGGGAKGIAYIGALRAMAEKRCWVRRVALMPKRHHAK